LVNIESPAEVRLEFAAANRQRAGGVAQLVRDLLGRRLAVVGAFVIVALVIFSFILPSFYHSDQTTVNVIDSFSPPSAAHPLGTDGQGFDVLGRMMKGGQASLEIGLLAALIATVVGTVYGAVSGLAGGWIDAAMMRFVDVLLSIPFLFIVLIVATKYGSSILTLSVVLGAFSWLVPARLVRGEVLTLRSRDFVSVSRVMGAGKTRIVFGHLIPNALGVVVVNITFQVADAILAVATIGFLGFGLTYPNTDWGDQLSSGVT
jgi:ABC-type dipeptide/oligopeptide/nickel transport system permease subunit